MEHSASKLIPSPGDGSTEFVPEKYLEHYLERYYDQLVDWGLLLTRGDATRAEDIVHDLCLHLALSRPDLSAIANLDGYLYTSLRHIYLSSLARASREAGRFVSVAEFDFIESALAFSSPGDALLRQNDLRRICGYSVWRKADSKTFSYFILHFFHGYGRQEIAHLACLPLAGIYNKLKSAREEIKTYLAAPAKLRFTDRKTPPEPTLSRTTLSSPELFRELRGTILAARHSDCLPEDELLSCYRASIPAPISCSLLAHIVSCERCLDLLDHHFRRPTLKDREPVDGFGSVADRGGEATAKHSMARRSLFRSLRRQQNRIFEQRPAALSIAVNGRIVARHDLRGRESVLSARVERPEEVQFVEIFSDLDVRLALVPVLLLPPAGAHTLTQTVHLSDARLLELNLAFDGQGLHCEAAYFDPAFADADAFEDEEEAAAPWIQRLPMQLRDDAHASPSTDLPESREPRESIFAYLRRLIDGMTPPRVAAWAILLAGIFCVEGYWLLHRAKPLDAQAVLTNSLRIETAELAGQTEHRILQFEDSAESSNDRHTIQQGTIEVWRDGDGARDTRRVYDSQHRLIAAEALRSAGNGSAGSKSTWFRNNKLPDHELPDKPKHTGKHSDAEGFTAAGLLDQDLSSRAFIALGGSSTQIRTTDEGYELTTTGPSNNQPNNQPRLVAATLTLDRGFHPLREVIRERRASGIHELRLVQTNYERKPSHSVPDAVFELDADTRSSLGLTTPGLDRLHPGSPSALAELQIATLYELNRLAADTAAPIEVARRADGRLHVTGYIADDALRQQIRTHLESLTDHDLLDIQLTSAANQQGIHPSRRLQRSTPINLYDLSQSKPPSDPLLRHHFEARGLSGSALDAAVTRFSREALEHGQHAVQHAYALDRLGSAITQTELRAVSLSAQRQWTGMVAEHAAALESQLTALHDQLATLTPLTPEAPHLERTGSPAIDDPAQFSQAAESLSRQVQELNQKIGDAFASTPEARPLEAQSSADTTALLFSIQTSLPLHDAAEMTHLAKKLNSDHDEGR